MKPEEFDIRMKEIEETKALATKALIRSFVDTFEGKRSIGEIITDKFSDIDILIDRITIYPAYAYRNYPQPSYHGFIVNKDGTINKRKKRDFILHERIKAVV